MRKIPQKNSDCLGLGHVSIAGPIIMPRELMSGLCYLTSLVARSVGYQERQTCVAGGHEQFPRIKRLLLWEDYGQ